MSLLLALRVPDTLTFNPFGCCFRSSQVIFLHSCSISALLHAPCRLFIGFYSSLSIYFPLSKTLFWELSLSWSPLSFVFSIQGISWLLPLFPPLHRDLEILKAMMGFTSFVFLSSRISLLDIQCLENLFYIFLWLFLNVSGGKINMILAVRYCLQSEIYIWKGLV